MLIASYRVPLSGGEYNWYANMCDTLHCLANVSKGCCSRAALLLQILELSDGLDHHNRLAGKLIKTSVSACRLLTWT